MKAFVTDLLLASTAIVATTSAAMAERTLRATVQVAVNHPIGANVVTFKEKLEEISGGEMSVEIYDSAQLFKGSEVPKAVASGAIDMGVEGIAGSWSIRPRLGHHHQQRGPRRQDEGRNGQGHM